MTQNIFYVYDLIDPRTMQTFYVGKGKGDRISHHVKDAKACRVMNTVKHQKIIDIISNGFKVIEKKVHENLSEKDAFDLERARIKEMSETLTNISSGSAVNGSVSSEVAKKELQKMGEMKDWVSSCYEPNKQAFLNVFGTMENAYMVLTNALRSMII